MDRLPRPDGDLAYLDLGRGPGLTLLHGFTQSSASLGELAEGLAEGRRLLLPDLRGHGASRFPATSDHGMAACAADLLALWDALDLRQVDLLGYSMGGRLAVYLALQHPERLRSLILVSAHAGLEAQEVERRRRSDAELARRIEREGVERFLESWFGQPLFAGLGRRGEEFLRSEREARLGNRPEQLSASLRDLGAGTMPSLWERLPGLRVSTLVVAGAEDQRYLEYGRRLVAALPVSRLAVVPDCGHAVPLEQPQRLAHLVLTFLSRSGD